MRPYAGTAVRCGCLGLLLAVLTACNGDAAVTPSASAPTPTVAASPLPAPVTPPTTPVTAAPRLARTPTPTTPPAPAATAQTQQLSTPIPITPSTAAATGAPSPRPSPGQDPPAPTPSPPVTEQPTAAPTPARATVGRIATALTVDGLQRPQDLAETFGLDDRIYISVEFRDVREGARLGFRWSSGACGGEYQTGPQQALRRGYFAFYVDETNCVGEHTVEITVDGAVLAVTSFVVENPG